MGFSGCRLRIAGLHENIPLAPLRRSETACPGISMRDQALETIVIDAIAERLLRAERLNRLLKKWLMRREGS